MELSNTWNFTFVLEEKEIRWTNFLNVFNGIWCRQILNRRASYRFPHDTEYRLESFTSFSISSSNHIGNFNFCKNKEKAIKILNQISPLDLISSSVF